MNSESKSLPRVNDQFLHIDLEVCSSETLRGVLDVLFKPFNVLVACKSSHPACLFLSVIIAS